MARTALCSKITITTQRFCNDCPVFSVWIHPTLVCMAAHKGWMDPKAITLTARLWSAFIAAVVAGIPFAFVGGIVGGIAIVVAPPAMAAVFILWVLYSVGAID